MAMGEPGELQPCVVCILHLKSNGWRSTRSRGGGHIVVERRWEWVPLSPVGPHPPGHLLDSIGQLP